MEPCTEINAPIAVFRGCTLSELVRSTVAIFGTLFLVSLLILLVFLGVMMNTFLYALFVAIVLVLPIAYCAWGILGKFKQNKPNGYYGQCMLILYEKHLQSRSIQKNKLYIPSNEWTVQRRYN